MPKDHGNDPDPVTASQMVDLMANAARMGKSEYQRRRGRLERLTRPSPLIPSGQFEVPAIPYRSRFNVSEKFDCSRCDAVPFDGVSDSFRGVFGNTTVGSRSAYKIEMLDLPAGQVMPDVDARRDMHEFYELDMAAVWDVFVGHFVHKSGFLKADATHVFYAFEGSGKVWGLIAKFPSLTGRVTMHLTEDTDPRPWQGPVRFFSHM